MVLLKNLRTNLCCSRRIDVPCDTENVWKSVDEFITENITSNVSRRRRYITQYGDGKIVQFTQPTLHTAVPAVGNGWRLFFRLAMSPNKPKNQIRKQVQVYIDNFKGW